MQVPQIAENRTRNRFARCRIALQMESTSTVDSPALRQPVWLRRGLTTLAVLLTLVVFPIVLGEVFPALPAIGIFSTVLASIFALQIVFVALLAFVIAFAALRLVGRRWARLALLFAALAFLGSLIPLGALVRAAHLYGAPISWMHALRPLKRAERRSPSQSLTFATIDGKPLFLDLYLPTTAAPGKSAPVLMLHGGGYVQGRRSDFTHTWDAWLADRGYTVFDADYRLAPPVTWNLAAQDAACAAAWIQSHAAEFNVDPDRLLISGQSAGAGLALQVAYGLGDGTVVSSCGGTVPQPKAVFAIYPPEDFELGWNLNTALPGMSARSVENVYLGGSPQQYPDRYRAVSAVYHARAGLPPTLIASGNHDHLVPYGGHLEMIDALNRAGVPNLLVTIPYAEHGYDIAWNSVGTQITRHAAAEFLDRYLPARR
jgi:acetyl esterase/lipase